MGRMSERDHDFDENRRAWLRAALATTAAGALSPSALAANSAYVPHPRAASYRFRVQSASLNPDGKKAVTGITVNGL